MLSIAVDRRKQGGYCKYNVSTIVKSNLRGRRRARSTRINLRINPRTKALLVQAAELQEIKLTDFMVKASQVAAEAVLAERNRFVLSPEKWRQFNAALDAPPRDIPALRQLFRGASPFGSP